MPKERILPHIILGILGMSDERVTGKQITDYVQRDLGEFWQVAHSQVYPELKRMVADEWITCHAVPGNDKERQYEMTAEGRKVLDQWLSIPNDITPLQKDIFSLKMFFIKDKNDPKVRELLTSQIALVEKHLKHMQQRKADIFSSQGSEERHYGHYLIVSRAIDRNQKQLKWLQDTIDSL